jgi:predicted nucleotidyltransferase
VRQNPDADVLEHDPALAEIVRRLVEALRPDRIYLFGSRARGEAGPDSDYDLMVIVPTSDLPGYRRDQLAYRALLGMGVAKDVVVWTREEFDRRARVPASFPATIVREGRLLYAT